MADKRMFSKKIIGSGRFLRMPPTARLLYYDLGMYADDDGVVEAYTVITQTKANEDDLRVLVAKGFVRVLNPELVTLILDWNTNNLIRGDRYRPSVYKEILCKLEQGCQPNDNQMTTTCQPNDNQWLPQDRLGKDKLGKYNNTLAHFEAFWSAYPRKKGKANAQKAWVKIHPDDALFEQIIGALNTQKSSRQWQRDNGQFIPYPATWLNQKRWEDEPDPKFSAEGRLVDEQYNSIDF